MRRRALLITAALAVGLATAALTAVAVTVIHLHRIEHAQDGTD